LVPVEQAHRLERVFKDKKITYDIKLYPEQGHGFFGPDARTPNRAFRFFDKYLKTKGAKR